MNDASSTPKAIPKRGNTPKNNENMSRRSTAMSYEDGIGDLRPSSAKRS